MLYALYWIFFVADALKLVVKENVIPAHSAKTLFFLAPIIVLLTSLLGWGVMPFGTGFGVRFFNH